MAQAPPRCLNHTDRTAVARCKQCHKPICEKCVKKMPGGVYCSDECYQNMLAFQNRVKRLDEAAKPKSAFGRLMGKLFTAVAVLIVVAILYYVFVSRGVRSVDGFVNLIRGLVS
jgi:hypothetical protein